MPDLSDGTNWFEVDANNNKASPNGWPEGMMPSGVNDTARADKGALKRFWDRVNPVQSVTRSGTLWTFTTANVAYPTAYITGEVYCFKAASSSIGGDTFQVNALGGKPIWKRVWGGTGWTPIIAQDISSGLAVQLIYDAGLNAGVGAFIFLDPFVPITGDGAGGVYMPGTLAVTGYLTASGGLSSGGDILLSRAANPSYLVRPNVAGQKGIAFAVVGAFPLDTFYVNSLASSFSGTLAVTGQITSSTGYQTRAGTPGPVTAHSFNIDWTGAAANLWIDNVNVGPLITSPGGNISASGNLTVGGNINQSGNYIYLAGGSGTVNTAGGPFIYADMNSIVAKLGPGNEGFYVQNYGGYTVFQVDGNGNVYCNGTINGNGLYIGGIPINPGMFRSDIERLDNTVQEITHRLAALEAK